MVLVLLRAASPFGGLSVEAVKVCGSLDRLPAYTERVKVVITHELAYGDHLVKVLRHVLLAIDAVEAVRHELPNLSLVLAEGLQGVHLQLDLLPGRVQVLQVNLRLVAAGGA